MRPDLVVGTSVGAMNATFVALDPTVRGMERLVDIWLRLKASDLFPGSRAMSWARMVARGNRLFDNSGLRRVIGQHLGAPTFEETIVPLAMVATELETGAETVLRSGDITRALLASSAMPGVFPPVELGGRALIDGGVSNNVPIGPAVEMGANTVYVLDSTSHGQENRQLARPFDYLLHAFSLARAQRLSFDRSFYGSQARLVMVPMPSLGFHVPMDCMDHAAAMIHMSYVQTRRFLSLGGVNESSIPAGDATAAPARPAMGL